MLFDEGNVTEPVASPDQTEHPSDGARNGIELKARTSHVTGTCHQRGKRANDRYETSQEDRFASVSFVERVRFRQSRLIDPADRAVVDLTAQPFTDHKVCGVTQACADRGDRSEDPRVHGSACRYCPRNEQKRITGQERHHDDPGLKEKDHEHDDVDEDAVVIGDRHQEAVSMGEKIKE